VTMTAGERRERRARIAWTIAAVVGLVAGLQTLWLHLSMDPLGDIHAYYEAAGRLNAGLPLYPPDQSVETPLGYPYPPLLAILFRPLALLPFATAAAIWEVVVIASLVVTVWWIGPRRRETWLALGILAFPIAWSVVIGQAQVLLTLFTAIGAPWSIALAANIKLFPALIALWWIGRREWRRLGLFAATLAGLGILQLILAPQATVDYLTAITLKQVGEVRNLSPYAISPLLWGALVIAGAGIVVRLAPTRWGWVAAVAFSVLATPRLLSYMFMTLIAAVRDPASRHASSGRGSGPMDRP
jgi:Glycosyltransferase family 87